MKLLTYDDMTISMLECPSNPNDLVRRACAATMFKDSIAASADKLLDLIIEAEHTSVLEHVTMVFDIRNVSRSFMSQITRHRMASYSVASQHYTDYRDMPMVVHPKHKKSFEGDTFEYIIQEYIQLIDHDNVPHFEARQVLPNACAVKIIWTINARSMLNFLRQRCCNRNTDEMQVFANKLYELFVAYWPEMRYLCGPPCFTEGKCNQKKLQCKEQIWDASTRLG